MPINAYCRKHVGRKKLISEPVSQDLLLSVVIPAHNEPNLLHSLQSLADCEAIDGTVEVIVVINAAENAEPEIHWQNSTSYKEAKQWASLQSLDWMKFYFLLENNLPRKHAGVGLARKIGMDEAAQRLFSAGNPKGVIACFDADSSCSSNYLVELISHFTQNPDSPACSVYFEHPTFGEEFPAEVYSTVQFYELHLRYYRQALKFAGAPFAYHTVGSSMAVRAEDYCRQGGMNKRKAGEDFYFLQKFIELGNFSELNTASIFPSPRPSDRVPFGTGRSVKQHLNLEKEISQTYHPHAFLILKEFLAQVSSLFKGYIPPPAFVLEFAGGEETYKEKLKEIREQSRTEEAFEKRFFRWFNAFTCLKFVHFLRDQKFGNYNVVEAAVELEEMAFKNRGEEELIKVLQRFRRYDKC